MKTITETEAYEMWDDFLDEMETVKIGTLQYSPSRVLREVDEIAYWCGMLEYIDSLGYELE